MKLFLIAIIATFMVTTTIQAQHTNVGVKGGLNLYNVINENSSEGDQILGYHLGLLVHFHLNDQFAFQPEVVFSTQGTKFENAGIETELKLSYVNVPFLLQYMFDNGFRLQAGPQLGFLVNDKTEVNGNDFDNNNEFESLELGASFGVGYINTNSNLGIDLRYNMGLTDIDKSDSEDSYNRGFQAGIFFLFNHN